MVPTFAGRGCILLVGIIVAFGWRGASSFVAVPPRRILVHRRPSLASSININFLQRGAVDLCLQPLHLSSDGMDPSREYEGDPSPTAHAADTPIEVVDIGINLTHRAFIKHWREVVQRAIDAGVTTLLLTGTSVATSRHSLQLAQEWFDETGNRNLYATVGVHPHDAKAWDDGTLKEMRELLAHPLAVAVGECGLDFNRNFSPKDEQIRAFREQVQLAVELDLPLFVHEREAHCDLLRVLDEWTPEELPPIVVHCFTGTKEEALEYIRRGYYVGFACTICKKERGAPLRDLLPSLPLENIMIETDAPFMGFKRGRRSSEPADCIDVARTLAETVDASLERVCDATTLNARRFFRIE